MKFYMFSIILSVTMFACKSNKVGSADDAKPKTLILKHGGGFTGKYTTYYIQEDGQLWKGSKTEGVKNQLKNLPKDAAKQIFSNYDLLRIADAKVVTYGNLLYTITMEDGDTTNKVSWEKGDKGSETLALFFRSVMNQIKINSDDYDPNSSTIKANF